MEFHSYHGCLPQERLEGARYLVDFACEYDISAAAESDNLEDTLNYGTVYKIVAREMAVPSNLLEHVAARIATSIRNTFPEAGVISVKVSKEHPPVNGPAAWSSVSVEI